MAQDLQRATFKNFSKGLVTDRSPLNAEPNTMADVQNMVLNRDGSVQRRLGFDIETGSDYRNFTIDNSPNPQDFKSLGEIDLFLWDNVGDDPDFNIAVLFSAHTIYFFDASFDPLEDGFINRLNVSFAGFSNNDRYGDLNDVSFVSANGELVATSAQDEIITVFEYDISTGSVVQIREDRVAVRDIWGWKKKKGVRDRYTANADESGDLTQAEEIDYAQQAYERINRGWPPQTIKDYSDYQVTNGAADVLWLPPMAASPQIYKNNNLDIDFGLENSLFFGKSPSRGGSTVVDLFLRGGIDLSANEVVPIDDGVRSSRAAEFNKLLNVIGTAFSDSTSAQRFEDRTEGGIRDCGYFYGRFWYIFNAKNTITQDEGEVQEVPRIDSLIAFSKITSDNTSLGECFQEADPTSEFISDRLPTDGGTISIREMETPMSVNQLLGGILVFARNGVWYITSGSEGFNPTEFIVQRLSNYGPISKNCVIEANNEIYFLGKEDIYRITPNEEGTPSVQNISFGVVGDYYDTVRKKALIWCRGTYDGRNKKVIWQWHQEAETVDVDRMLADTQLVYDLILGAFTLNKISTESPEGVGYLGPPLFISGADRDSTGKVIHAIFKGDPNSTDPLNDNPVFNFGNSNNTLYKDFESEGGSDADAFFLLNHYAGDAQVQNQVPTLTTHSKLTETGLKQDANGDYTILENPGSIKVQAYWDFTDKLTGWGNPDEFQAYKLPRAYLSDSTNGSFDYGKTVITTNNKIEGRGRALQLKFSSEPEHDFHLYGVTMLTASNQTY